MLGRALCISNAREPDGPEDRSRIASVPTTLKGNNFDGDAGRLGASRCNALQRGRLHFVLQRAPLNSKTRP